MKLCRFELRNQRGVARSGLYYDERVYETDGQNAIGVHDPGDLVLLPPIGLPPAIRLYEPVSDPLGEVRPGLSFANPARLQGTASEVPVPEWTQELDFEARVVAVLSSTGARIGVEEASGFLLGFTMMVRFVAVDLLQDELSSGQGGARATDIATGVGPFLVTPEELDGLVRDMPSVQYIWPYLISVNGTEVASGTHVSRHSFGELMEHSSLTGPLFAGEMIASEPFPKPMLMDSALGRALLPGDKVEFAVEGLERLVVRAG